MQKLVTPPLTPAGQDRADKSFAERAVGIALPDGYWAFGRAYGSGRFQDGCRINVFIINPCSTDFEQELGGLCDTLSEVREALGSEYVPYPVHPARDGLLPYGWDDNRQHGLLVDKGGGGGVAHRLDPRRRRLRDD